MVVVVMLVVSVLVVVMNASKIEAVVIVG